MSAQIPGHPPGPQGFKQILDRALEEYTTITGTNLALDPLASKLRDANSISRVIEVYEDQLHRFKRFRGSGKKGKVITALKPVVEVTLALSGAGGILGDALGSAFPPAKAILGAIGILLQAAKKVSASYDALVGLFESISNFLEHLKIYTDRPHNSLAPRMSAILVKITVQMLSIFALATQQIRQGRLKKFAKTFLGLDPKIDDAVKALDKLTAEEQRVVAALTLWTVQGLAADMSKQRLREWLLPPDSSMNHNDTRRRHYEGTSTWLVKSSAFLEWKEQGSLLWISGKPGAGKTFLCSTVVEDLRNLPANPGVWKIYTAYFYCTFRDTEKQNIQGLLRSILHQLSAQSDTYFAILFHLFSEKYSGDPKVKPIDTDLVRYLKEMLKYSDGIPTYIIVDGLDECPNSGTTSERQAILKLLEDLVGLKLPALRLCVTSRPEDDIGSILRPLVSQHVALERSREQDEDIIQYIRSMIESHGKMRAWPVKTKEMVIGTLSENASGMFRYASCQLDVLCDCHAANIETTLAALPKTLQETYEVALERIEDGKWQSAHRLFQCLSFSTRPLRVEELAEVLAIDFRPDIPEHNIDWRDEDPERAVLSFCPGSFVTIVGGDDDDDDEDEDEDEDEDVPKFVQFAHFSVKEFLVSYVSSAQDNPRVVRFRVMPEPSHTTLARACLAILFLIGDRPESEESTERDPLAEYAAEYWVDHARFEDASLSITASLQHFFRTSGPYLSAWIQLHDPHSAEIGFSTHRFNRFLSLESNAPLYCAALCGLRHAVRELYISNPEGANEIGGPCGAPLHAASIAGHVEIAKLLLDLGADVNRQCGYYGTALQAACRGGIDVMQLLLERGADVNAQGGEYGTALQLAAALTEFRSLTQLFLEFDGVVDSQSGEYGTALQAVAYRESLLLTRLLLDHGADVNPEGGKYGTALQAAASEGSIDVTRLLLDHGADVNAKGGKYGTALQAAAYRKSLPITQLLLEHSADVNAQGGEYGTALHAAASGGSIYVTRLLLDHGADVNAQGGKYGTALHLAAFTASLPITQLLLEHGADVNTQGGEYGTALHLAAVTVSLPITQLLLKHGADVNAQGGEYGTALQAAAYGESLPVTQLLLEHGADVNAQAGKYGTALQAAAYQGCSDITQLLLEHGANVNSRGGEYGTALHIAAVTVSLPITQLLLKHGTDVNAQGGRYGTALQAAAFRKSLPITQLLLEHGADVNAQCGYYGTALQAAAYGNSLIITQLLLERGANVHTQAGKYCTPLQGAAACPHDGAIDIVRLLLEHGADPSVQGGEYGSALQAALSNRNTKVAQLLSPNYSHRRHGPRADRSF